jgi:hypothetical protein
VKVFRDAGISARLTPELVGIDLSVAGPKGRTVVQATGSASPIAQDVVWEIHWERDYYQDDAAMVITNSAFSPAARAAASGSGVVLWDCQELQDFLHSGRWPGAQQDGSWKQQGDDRAASRPNAQSTTGAASPVQDIADFARRRPVVTGLVVLCGASLLYGSQNNVRHDRVLLRRLLRHPVSLGRRATTATLVTSFSSSCSRLSS